MNIGDRYTSPWGEYTVVSLEPLVLQGIAACIVSPSSETVARMEFVGSGACRLHSTLQTRRGTGSRPAAAQGGDSPCESAEQPSSVDGRPDADEALSCAHELTLGAYRSTMSLAWAPSVGTVSVWVPCAGRSSIPEHTGKTHAYFISSLDGSIYCPECRARRPRILHLRDGVVVRDSHHDVASASTIRLGVSHVEAPGREFSRPVLSPEVTPMPLCTSGADEEFASSDLLAAAAARESVAPEVPPTSVVLTPTDDAKAHPSPRDAPPPTCLSLEQSCSASGDQLSHQVPVAPTGHLVADDPKASVGTFEHIKHTTPIGRAWLGLWEWKEWCAERAAIMEFDGGMSRELAERRTREIAGAAPRAA